MVKIGVMTFHRAVNYGAVLQTYALQQAICDCGGDCEVIDFRSHCIEDFYKPFSVCRSTPVSMIKQFVKALMTYHSRKNKKTKTEQFLQEYIHLTQSVTSGLEQYNSMYDGFVTGSDQVFNTDISGADAKKYFLSFAEKPRFSYAASFGKNDLAQRDQSWVGEELKKFHDISVREESGVPIVDALTGRTARVNLDPTLLQNCDAWRKIEKQPKKAEMPFILVYNMLSSELLYESARKLARKKNMNVVVVNNKRITLKKQFHDFIYRDDLSPQEFLWMMDRAQYVLCSSFHGVVFSLLFHKQFLSVLPVDEPRNARIASLLDMVSLRGRLFTDVFDVDMIEDEISWRDVDTRLKEKRMESMSYIQEIIRSCDTTA